jgi:hypothetical protein
VHMISSWGKVLDSSRVIKTIKFSVSEIVSAVY